MRQIFPFEEAPSLWDDMVTITELVADGLVDYAAQAIADVHEQHYGTTEEFGFGLPEIPGVIVGGSDQTMWGRLPDGTYMVQGCRSPISEEHFISVQEYVQRLEQRSWSKWAGYSSPHPRHDFDPTHIAGTINGVHVDLDTMRQEIAGNWTPEEHHED